MIIPLDRRGPRPVFRQIVDYLRRNIEGGRLPAGTKLYAVHLTDGRRIAVMDDRNRAFAAAVQHDLHPVSVH